MEGSYGVNLGRQLTGKVQVARKGLYYHFTCRCHLTGEIIYRLQVSCGSGRENLGVLIPADGGFGLDTKVPVKRFQEGMPEFLLLPKHEKCGETFVPIYPEEPFAYLARLKEAYLVHRNGCPGILIQEAADKQNQEKRLA